MKLQNTFMDMVIQRFLKWCEFWRYFPFPFRDMGHFSKYVNVYDIRETPLPGPQ